MTIRVLTSIIKIRKGVVHIMVSSKLTMKARSAKTSARVMWHPPLLDEHREENFKKHPPMLISFQRTM